MNSARLACSAWSMPPMVFRRHQSKVVVCATTHERTPSSPSQSPIHNQEKRRGAVTVDLRDVSLAYGGKTVLKGLNLKIYAGESTAIIGTSGTGKSTTLRLISGLEQPTSGEVIINGIKRTKTVHSDIHFSECGLRIGMVFQNAALFDSLTVGENVGFRLLRERNLSEERIYDIVMGVLIRVGLSDAIEKKPEQLSGGMRKRVSIARALAYDPDDDNAAPGIMLFDEPTAGLDPTASTTIEDLIRSSQTACPTCVIVTHQYSTIRRTADRVVMLHNGGVVWDGSIYELDRTENPYIRQFMTASTDGPLFSIDTKESNGTAQP